MTEQEHEVMQIVKKRLALDSADKDDLIGTYLQEIGNRIKHYCNIRTIPAELNYVWASMVTYLVHYVQGTYEEKLQGHPSSIKEGDTQVSLNQINKIISPAISNETIDGIILNYKADLHRYRRMRW